MKPSATDPLVLLLALLVSVSGVSGLKIPRHATLVSREATLETYDFVIVGGGISGLTVADRLTEDAQGDAPCDVKDGHPLTD